MKVKIERCLLLIVSLMSLQSIHAQIFTTVFDEDALQFRVKQIDEFFARFNYETDYKGEKPNDSANKEEHRKNLLTLFNLEKFSNEKQELDPILNKFVDYVINNHVKIHYEDTTWCAEAKGSLMFEGKRNDVTFLLKTERTKDVIFRWVVTEVQSPIFNSFPHHSNDSICISPADHGIGFMTLPEMFNYNKASVGTAFAKGYQRDNLVVFDYLMAKGKIKMNAITKVVFHFHLKNIRFDVERIEKDKGYNQGWLINNIIFE